MIGAVVLAGGQGKRMHRTVRESIMFDRILRTNRHAMAAKNAGRLVLYTDTAVILVKNPGRANLHATLATDATAVIYLQFPNGQCFPCHFFSCFCS